MYQIILSWQRFMVLSVSSFVDKQVASAFLDYIVSKALVILHFCNVDFLIWFPFVASQLAKTLMTKQTSDYLSYNSS